MNLEEKGKPRTALVKYKELLLSPYDKGPKGTFQGKIMAMNEFIWHLLFK